MLRVVLSFVTGGVFGVGLVVGGMTQPSKVIGFLDVAGDWDPSLALVMGAAIAVFSPLYHVIRLRRRGAFSTQLFLPPQMPVDMRLLLGSAVFGIGWGLGGYCPGPGIVALGSRASGALVFVFAMVIGMALFHVTNRLFARRPSVTTTPVATSASQVDGSSK